MNGLWLEGWSSWLWLRLLYGKVWNLGWLRLWLKLWGWLRSLRLFNVNGLWLRLRLWNINRLSLWRKYFFYNRLWVCL